MTGINRGARAALYVAAAVPAIVASQAWAQANPRTTELSRDDIEEIIVTGTSLRGVAPIGASVTTVGRDDITATTATSTVDILKSFPQVLNLGVDEGHRGAGGAGNRSGASSVNLHGLGPGATLTLVNSHRVALQGLLAGAFVDPSVMPTIAVQRVEILADGGSAIYGSDAIAGVVNLIPRTKFSGLELSGRYGLGADKHYSTFQLGAIAGKQWSTGGIVVAFEYSGHDALTTYDRDFALLDLRSRGGGDYRVPQCSPGNYLATIPGVGLRFYPIPAGGAAVAPAQGAPNLCDVPRGDLITLIPTQERKGAFLTFHQELSDRIEIVGDGFWYDRKSLNPTAITQHTYTITPASPASIPRLTGLPPGSVQQIALDLTPYTGGKIYMNPRGNESYSINVGAKVALFGDWRGEVYGTISRSKEFDHTTNWLDTAGANALIDRGVINPFAPSLLSEANLALLADNLFVVDTVNKQKEVRAQVDGSLFNLPGGPMKLAVGATYRREEFVFTQRGPLSPVVVGPAWGTVIPQTGYSISRDIKSVYGEVSLPLVGPETGISFLHRVDLSAAVRYDDYGQSTGNTTNPKFGLNISPVEGLTLRGSYGKSFHAPEAGNLGAGQSRVILQPRTDPTNGNATTLVALINDGNAALKPEKATTWTMGVDFKPKFLPGLIANITYWHVRYTDKFGGIGLSDAAILGRGNLYGSLFIKNPTVDQLAAASAGRICFLGGAATSCTDATNIKYLLDARVQNVGSVDTGGIDFSLSYSVNTLSLGNFVLAVGGTYLDTYREKVTQAAPDTERVNRISFPVRWRLRPTLNWSLDRVRANLVYNYTGGYDNDSVTPVQRIKAYETVDFSLAYTLPGTSIGKSMTLGLDISNLFDQDPPFANVNGGGLAGYGYDAQVANPIGRVISLTAGVAF